MKVKEPVTEYVKLDKEGSYTYLDYLRFQFKERVELFRGKVVKMSPAPNRIHQTIMSNLGRELGNFFYKKSCQYFPSPFDVRLFPLKSGKDNTVVQPDACVVCDEKKLDKHACAGAPYLVIEIFSPGNLRKELDIKFRLYEEAGVKEYWIVEPANKTILLYRSLDKTFIASKPFVEGEDVESILFPVLKVPVTEIFLNVK